MSRTMFLSRSRPISMSLAKNQPLTEFTCKVAFSEIFCWILEQLSGLAVFYEWPQVEEGSIIRDSACLLHAVSDDDHCVLSVQARDQLRYVGSSYRVQSCAW